MAKIPNIFKTTTIEVSQGLHFQPWGNSGAKVAIDFAYTDNLICPFDNCRIETYSNTYNGKQSYFSLVLPNGSKILVVHSQPIREGVFNKGEAFAKCMSDHYHLSMFVGGKLDCILNYLDRNIPMRSFAPLYRTTTHLDGRWSTYQDLQLNIQTFPAKPQDTDMFKDDLIKALDGNPNFYPERKKLFEERDANYIASEFGMAWNSIDKLNEDIRNKNIDIDSWNKYAGNRLFGNDQEKDSVFTGDNADIASFISNNKIREMAYTLKETREKLKKVSEQVKIDEKKLKNLSESQNTPTIIDTNDTIVMGGVKTPVDVKNEGISVSGLELIKHQASNLDGIITRAQNELNTPEKVNTFVNTTTEIIDEVTENIDEIVNGKTFLERSKAVQNLIQFTKDTLPMLGSVGIVLGATQEKIDLVGLKFDGYLSFGLTAVSLVSIGYIIYYKNKK